MIIQNVVCSSNSEVLMNGSINFLFHLLGFGLLFTALWGGWILERRLRAEQDWPQKLFVGKISRRFGILSPVASIIMLITGVINIFSLYNGNINLLYTEGWLIAKIILFAFLLINGAIFGPILVRRRTKLMQHIIEKNAQDDAEATIKIINKSISTFYLVQSLLLIIILYLSIAGGGKHSGIF
jgi:putative copper export protein